MLHEVILVNAQRDDTEAFRERLQADPHLQAALRSVEPILRPWFNVHTQSTFLREHTRKLQFQQWQTLLKKGWGMYPPGTPGVPGRLLSRLQLGNLGDLSGFGDYGRRALRSRHSCTLSFPVAKLAFINSNPIDQAGVGQAKVTDDMLTLEYTEFEECVARCALDKYKGIKHPLDDPMREPAMIVAFCHNLVGNETTEESLNTATLIKCPRYEWRYSSRPLVGQDVKSHRRWLAVWQRLGLADMFYFPVWGGGRPRRPAEALLGAHSNLPRVLTLDLGIRFRGGRDRDGDVRILRL